MWPVFLEGSPDDRDDTARVRIGDHVAWYVQLYDKVGDWPEEMIAELDVTVRRHGRGGGTAVLVSGGAEFAMDGDRYPTEGGHVRGALYELGRDDLPSVRLAPVVGVVRRIRIATRTRRGVELRDTEEVPKQREHQLGPQDFGFLVDIERASNR